MKENNFTINYSEDVSSSSISNHSHIMHELIFVIKGSAVFEIEGKQYVVKENSLLLISNFEKHKCLSISSDYHRYFCLFNNSFFDSNHFSQYLLSVFMNRNNNFTHCIVIPEKNITVFNSIFTTLYEEYNNDLPLKSLIFKSKINELLILINRLYPENFLELSQTPHSTVLQIQSYVNTHFCEYITLEKLTNKFFIDKSYLSRKFKDQIGVPFKKYIINLRILQAQQYLIDTNLTISKICTECGFNDLSNFIRTFQKETGTSPLQYRLKHKNNPIMN